MTHYLPFFTRRDDTGREQAVCGQFVTVTELSSLGVRPTCAGCAAWFDALDVLDPQIPLDTDSAYK